MPGVEQPGHSFEDVGLRAGQRPDRRRRHGVDECGGDQCSGGGRAVADLAGRAFACGVDNLIRVAVRPTRGLGTLGPS